MAIVTATIAAVAATMTAVTTIGAAAAGAATIGAAVAATASAVVAVSSVVGMVGLAVTAVGMITKNEDLLGAGKIMGYIGLGGSLLGFGVGAMAEGFTQFSGRVADLYSSSWDKGMGKMFSSADDAVSGAGSSAVTSAPKTAAAPPPGVDKSLGNLPAGATKSPIDPTAFATSPNQPSQGLLNSIPPPSTGAPPPSMTDPNAWFSQSVSSATAPPTVAGAAQAAQPSVLSGFLNNPMMPMAAGQIIAGGVGGLFEGAAKEKEVEMLELQNQRNEQQRQYLNQNNQYVPGTI